MDESAGALRQRLVDTAFNLLKSGKSQYALITYLRSQGIADEKAKELSYDIFREARKKLRKEQAILRVSAWLLITVGLLLPVALFLFQSRIVIFSTAPLFLGSAILFKLPNPKEIPR